MEDTLKKKIGQMFIIRLQGKTVNNELISLIKDYHVGGVSLYSKNYDNYEQMLSIINEIKQINKKYNDVPLFIAIDQEGGRVNRLPKDFKNIVSAKKLSKNLIYVKQAGDLIGQALNSLGINMDFAPVLDIQRFEDAHAIGDRCFGDTPEKVSQNGIMMMNTLKYYNVVPVIKHFPGHGLVKKDSHFFLPVVYKDIKQSEDVKPFLKAMDKDCDALMVSHIMLRKIDRIYPASLSKKVISGYLRGELKYDGLIITDDLKMKAVNLLYGYKRSAFKAISAGNNMVVIGSNYKTVMHAIEHIKKHLNPELEKHINSTYDKIIKIKEQYNVNDEINKPIQLEDYNKKVEELNAKANTKKQI